MFDILNQESIINEAIIRGLINNLYFFEIFPYCKEGIFEIINNPSKYKFTILDEDLDELINSLTNSRKLVVDKIIDMGISLFFIKCLLNSNIFFENLISIISVHNLDNIKINFKPKINRKDFSKIKEKLKLLSEDKKEYDQNLHYTHEDKIQQYTYEDKIQQYIQKIHQYTHQEKIQKYILEKLLYNIWIIYGDDYDSF